MRPPNSSLTDHELELMQLVWDRGQATVRDVYEAILERRKVAYTTVMTSMKTLELKGHLATTQQDRAYVYRPTRSKNQVIKSMVRDFVDRVFQGSASPLVAHLLEDPRLSSSDLAEINRMLSTSKKTANGRKNS